MEIKSLQTLLTLVFILYCSSIFSEGYTKSINSTPSNITWWCTKTPHPEPCNFFMKNSRQRFAPKHQSDFRKMLVQLAMDRAVTTQRQVMRRYGGLLLSETKHQKSAWRDCIKLYDNTILQLNRTLQGLEAPTQTTTTMTYGRCSDFDAQTWLSTALTNIRTCHLGSVDLNVSDFVVDPVMSSNLSRMISNSLAVNGVLLRENLDYNSGLGNGDDEFPSWVTRKERKLLDLASVKKRANAIVDRFGGSGHFRTVQGAIDFAAKRRVTSTRFVIYVKRGVYRENIEVGKLNNNIMIIGDGMRNTIITGSRSVGGGYTTYSSATAGIDGLHFIARDITFSNTAGPRKGQAVALRSASDLSVFFRCAIQGYQDTLMVHSQRQFYKECYIYGTIDFIFGNAAVVFQSCMIYARRPLKGQANVITAQGRDDPFQNTGITIQNSRIMAGPDLKPVVSAIKTYLGRPWQQYSRTVVINTYLDGLVSPLGWSPWGKTNFAQDTLYYAEYRNFGPAASTRMRVKWRGFHVLKNPKEASRYTVGSLIAGSSWLPATGVPFTSGL